MYVPSRNHLAWAALSDRERDMRHAAHRAHAARQRSPWIVRRVVGRSLVRIGSRLAADPSPEPARS